MKALFALAALFVGGFAFADPVPQHLVNASCSVVGEQASGSGVFFKNGDEVFVWTVGHVAAQCQHTRSIIDPVTGLPKVEITYDDLWVSHDEYEAGRKVGEEKWLAEVVRYSDIDNDGEDVALLHLRKHKVAIESSSFSTAIPLVGDAVWDVGSRMGPTWDGSVSKGVFSTAGRLVNGTDRTDVRRPKVYDQVTLDAQHGCSGGGVFNEKGECIGLLTQFSAGELPGSFFVVPARRIRDFAKRTHCEWALDEKVKPPAEGQMAEGITDRPVPIPKDWPSTNPPKEKEPDVWSRWVW